MLTTYLRHAAIAASMLGFAAAQSSPSVPKDLTKNFADSGVQLQASYTNNAVDGFADGTSFSKNDVSKEPTFALGDSSGISTTSLFTVIMVDTTNDNARTLHYARSNFKSSGIVNIDTQDAPIMAYKAPGSFGETGERKYTFLMYTNPQRAQIKTLKMPNNGETFNVKQFQTDNGLNDPDGGVGMVVKLDGGNGQASASASASSTSAAATSSASSISSTSTVASSSAVASTTSAPVSSTSLAASSASSPAVVSSSRSSALLSSSALLTSRSSTSAAATPSTSATGAPQQGGTAAQSSAENATTGVATAAPSVVQTSAVPAPSGSRTSTSTPAIQTTNSAMSVSVEKIHCLVAGSMLVIGTLFW